jgi:ABC-type branched-subunit amino acid transport system ATPase component
MLAIGKALMRRPRLLILDEPSTGLAPRVLESIGALVGTLRGADFALMIAEQNVGWALGLVNTAFVLDDGHLVDRVDCRDASTAERDRVLARYLGITPAAA